MILWLIDDIFNSSVGVNRVSLETTTVKVSTGEGVVLRVPTHCVCFY